MIQASLIIKPVMDKTLFHQMCESVTDRNYLRETDDKNLSDPTAEAISILDSYSDPHEGASVTFIGFMFIGTVDLIAQIPSIVKGNVLTNQHAHSAMIGSLIIVASVSEWQTAIKRSSYCNHQIDNCFQSVADQVQSLIVPKHNRPRLN